MCEVTHYGRSEGVRGEAAVKNEQNEGEGVATGIQKRRRKKCLLPTRIRIAAKKGEIRQFSNSKNGAKC